MFQNLKIKIVAGQRPQELVDLFSTSVPSQK